MSTAPPEGARLVAGRYRLGELLGRGGMGAVWLAVDELLGREVALKRLRVADLPDDEAALARERIMREARIAASLHHPQVVSIFDVVVEDAEPWLVLEYLPSVSLGRMLRDRGRLPVAEVAAIGAQVAGALAAAHAAGIVHRDVKPDNVLVAGPVAKLTDFGISSAAATPSLTQTGMLTGTPAYLAPESCRGEGTDARSDVYALGATLYAAVEGAPPFGAGGDLLVLIGRIAHGQAPPPQRAGPLTELLGAMLAGDPRARPNAAQVRDALLHLSAPDRGEAPTQAVAAGPTVPLHPPPAGPAPAHPRRTGLLVAAALGVLAVLAAGVAGALLLGGGSGTGPAAAVSLGDPRTADPCSLIDTVALARHGTVTVDQANVPFSGCRADLRPAGGGALGLSVEFTLTRATNGLDGDPEQVDGVTLQRLRGSGSICARELLLADRTVVAVYAQGQAADLCAVADTGARAAARILGTRGAGAREPLDVTSPLAGVDACTLLDADALAAVPGARSPGTPGFGDWSCSWGSPAPAVYVNFDRGEPPDPRSAITVQIVGRAAAIVPGDGRCRVELVQRRYRGSLGERADLVQLTVFGRDDGTCGSAAALATAAAGKLPAPG
ncbi:MAG: serine/threonine-protein kinase [Pseudonocardia sp.]